MAAEDKPDAAERPDYVSDPMSDTSSATVRIVTASPWQEAVIAVLEPRSPYRPWTEPDAAEPGDAVIVVLDTDPVSVLAGVGVVGPDADVHHAIAGRIRPGGLAELATVNMLSSCFIDPHHMSAAHGERADAIVAAIGGHHFPGNESRFGHTSLAAARVLLHSGGRCTACERRLRLTDADAADLVHVHTAVPFPVAATSFEPRPVADWPGALCDPCHARMRAEGFGSLVDFIFISRPGCPECGARQAMSALFGMPLGPVEEPWIATMGCCVTEPIPQWACGACSHAWR